MNDLHRIIIESIPEGWDGFEESPDFPEGIDSAQLSEKTKKERKATVLYIPAKYVPESETSQKLPKHLLEERFVVYRVYRRGIGHDSTYG